MDLVIAEDDPRSEDVQALLQRHLAFAHEVTPPGHVHALDIDDLLHPSVTLFTTGAVACFRGSQRSNNSMPRTPS